MKATKFKKLHIKKQRLEKEISRYMLPLKLLNYSSAILYLGIIISIVTAKNLPIAIAIVVFIFSLFKTCEIVLKKACSNKKKKIMEIETQIFLSHKL